MTIHPVKSQHRPRMRLVAFRPLVKNSLRGFASVQLPNGLTIEDCPVNVSHGRAWASLPSKPQINRDGQQIEIDGKKAYAAILRWPSRSVQDEWSERVVALVREQHPEAFEPGDAS